MLHAFASYHRMQFQWNLIIQTQGNCEEPYFGPDLGLLGLYAANFFFRNLASSVARHHDQLSSCAISEETRNPILKKFSDGRTDWQTDKSDFIGRCPTDVERLISAKEENSPEDIILKSLNVAFQCSYNLQV